MSTGQLDTAARVSRRAVSALAGTDPIVVLEPSCASALRDDLPDLLGTAASHAVGRRTHSLAGFLAVYAPDWLPAPGPQRAAVGQVHCHQRASTGYADERRLLVAAGVDLTLPQAACCGLAGDFGMTPDHYDVSTACADQGLLSAVRAASDDTLLVCDGFSCRYQLADLTGRRALHSAQILARGPLPAS
jgi:Fe-S oxidoreductase